MKKLSTALVLSLALVGAANAGIEPYAGIKLGYAFTSETDRYSAPGYKELKEKIDQKDTFGGSLEIGAKISEYFRLGFERNQWLKFKDELDGEWTTTSWMLNIYAERQIKESAFYGIATGGLGVGAVTAKWGSNEEEKTGLAVAFGLGVAYRISDDIMLDLMWRYSRNPSITGATTNFSPNPPTANYSYESSRNEVLLGARYMF